MLLNKLLGTEFLLKNVLSQSTLEGGALYKYANYVI